MCAALHSGDSCVAFTSAGSQSIDYPSGITWYLLQSISVLFPIHISQLDIPVTCKVSVWDLPLNHFITGWESSEEM